MRYFNSFGPRIDEKGYGSVIARFAAQALRGEPLTVYGDVNLSELREMPPGRQEVATRVVPPHLRDEAYRFIRDHVSEGRQA